MSEPAVPFPKRNRRSFVISDRRLPTARIGPASPLHRGRLPRTPERARLNLWHIVAKDGRLDVRFGRACCGDLAWAEHREWLVCNGIGGYAMGTIAGLLNRRYHGYLVASARPPADRRLLVPKIDETVQYLGGEHKLGTNRWADGTIDPHGFALLERFRLEGTAPVWRFAVLDAVIEKRVWMAHGANLSCVRYEVVRAQAQLTLLLDLFGDGRGHHGTTRAAGSATLEAQPGGFRFAAPGADLGCEVRGDGVAWALHGDWYYRFELSMEADRGLDAVEDHFRAARGTVSLRQGDSCTVMLAADGASAQDASWDAFAQRERRLVAGWRERHGIEADGEHWTEQLAMAAGQFFVDGERGSTVIAGYPWFTDWGRDTMIALPGLALSTGRLDEARSILRSFAGAVDEGMIPNRFDETNVPEYNTVDATLWYVLAVDAVLRAEPDAAFARELLPVVRDIVEHHERGTRYGIRRDPRDGLLAAGEAGVQLTWMDARVDGVVITPRMGKPVEVNALWHNALRAAARMAAAAGDDDVRFETLAREAAAGFGRFWNEQRGYCFDVIDGPDGNDAALRPNQLFALALEEPLLEGDRARAVVNACARSLLTSYGLRSLAPDDPRYVGRYEGDPRRRDGAYHQGTVWCWLLGPFALAHARAYGDAAAAASYLEPLRDALYGYGVGTLGEIFDGDAPHQARGCIAQAWSVGQTLWAWSRLRSGDVRVQTR